MSVSYSGARLISSRATHFYKKSLPILWYGLIAAILLIGLVCALTNSLPRRAWPVFIVLPGTFTLVGVVTRPLFCSLLDEVYDGGDYLIFKNRGEVEQVPLTNVMNVSAATLTKPPRATLRLVSPGRFGEEVSFLLPQESPFKAFARSRIADDLIVRVDRARLRRVV
jgi:hypothetical protein